jgi:hypothetical protein
MTYDVNRLPRLLLFHQLVYMRGKKARLSRANTPSIEKQHCDPSNNLPILILFFISSLLTRKANKRPAIQRASYTTY